VPKKKIEEDIPQKTGFHLEKNWGFWVMILAIILFGVVMVQRFVL